MSQAPLSLPTMYDLPSEIVGEPGLPDEFHLYQPQLLSATFRPLGYPEDKIFTATDLNLYYDLRHTNWYKRPDWYAAVGVDRLYAQQELRLSYVIWQELVSPMIIVELLSPGTEQEDMGRTMRKPNQPPTKWEVYEQILRVPYYILLNRYTDELQIFQLVGNSYALINNPNDQLFYIPELQSSIGLWQGRCHGVERLWLRWYDRTGQLILTDSEQKEQERSLKEEAQARAERLAQRLRALGVDPDMII